jgi:hypothetical protein
MKRVPWTRFEDFYLRLGFLKVLAAVLSAERQSVPNEAIIRRLRSPLFDPVTAHPDLWSSVKDRLPEPRAPDKKHPSRDISPSVAEALLIYEQCPSILFAITGRTAHKILDWGRDVELIWRGNQITERGLLLRYLLDEATTVRLFAGEVAAWNIFSLTLKEKLFFLYHLAEIDGVIVDLILQLGELKLEPGKALETNEASRMTCTALLRVLKAVQGNLPSSEILKLRTASALAATIGEELEMTDEARDLVGSMRKIPKPIKPTARRAAFLAGGRPKQRRTTKNADHQTIPRFEQLVDLGFLTKMVPEEGTEREKLAARRRWLYIPTDVCRRWAAVLREKRKDANVQFLWNSFAAASIDAYQIPLVVKPAETRSELIAGYVWRAYEHVHRRVGANPLDTVALFAMLTAVSDGIAIEMSEIHKFMLFIKKHGLLPEHVFFASGNDLDQMFIQLKPGFMEQIANSRHAFATTEVE